MNQNTIVTYSFLVYVYENQRKDFSDFSDIFIPLFKRTLAKMYVNGHTKGESISEIKECFDTDYGLNVPFPIMRKILDKIEREEKYNGNKNFEIFKHEGFIIENIFFEDYDDEIKREEVDIEELNSAYGKYLELESISISNIPNLFDFIDDNRVYLSTYFTKKEPQKRAKEVIHFEDRDLLIQAKFIDFIKETRLFDTLKKIYLGSLISSYLETDYQPFKSDIELVFDTNFIIGVMSLSSRESYHTCNTLVEIAKKLNYKLSILPETIEETQNLLRRHSEYFDKSTFISLVDEQSIYASCHRQGLSGIDLERRATNLKIDLFDLGIFESAHGQADRAKFEPEYATFKRIRETDEGALKDTIALCYVKDKRKKKTINTFSDINCWFVSNTKTKLIYSGTYQEIIRAEDLLNILWLSNPTISNTREIMDSSLTRLVSTAMSKALPKNSTLQKLSGNIEKYLKKEKIRQTDVVSLARNLAEKTNKNFNEFNKIISSNSEEDKINFIKDTVQKQEKMGLC